MKKKSFFDIEESEEEYESTEQSEIALDNAKDNKIFAKKQLVIAVVCMAILLSAFFVLRQVYNSGSLSDSTYYPSEWLSPPKNEKPFNIKFCEPDWSSDIMNDPEYLALKGDIIYAPNDSVSYAVANGEYMNVGGKGLQLMANYVDAVIRGDHEELNLMFTEDYFEDNEPYEDFTEQRLYRIKIKKYHYKDPVYENSKIKDEYYIISYYIDKNDGLFRDDIGQESELAQLFELLIYPDGSVKIDNIIRLPGYQN